MDIVNSKLTDFINANKVPNILFHGVCMKTNTKTIQSFIQKLYNNNRELIKNYVMTVNCGHCKGIKFVREELKFFSKTHINNNGGLFFKSIVLLNADKLTIDAQSALRRCIEIFSHTTRFFIVVEDKYTILKPILSRFCEIHIPICDKEITIDRFVSTRIDPLKKLLNKHMLTKTNPNDIIELSNKLYHKAYSGLDIIGLIENESFLKITTEKRYELIFTFTKIKKEIRSEIMFIYMILNLIYNELNNTTICDILIHG